MVSGNDRSSMLRSAAVVGFFVLLSRLTGMFQSRLVASYLGAGLAADAFMVAFRIPNLLRRLTAEGTMASAFLVTLNEVEAKYGDVASRDLVAKFLGTLSFILMTLTLVMIPFMGVITGLQMLGKIAPETGWWNQLTVLWFVINGTKAAPMQWELTTILARIMFPYLVFVSLTAGLSVVLNLRKKFGLPASVSTFWNISFIAFAVFCFQSAPMLWRTPEHAVFFLAAAAVVGGVVQLFVVWPTFHRMGFSIKWGLHLKNPGVRKILGRMTPGLLGTGIHPINVLISTMLASQLATGAQTILFNSNMMGEMVLGVFATSLATVSLPTMSNLVVIGDLQGLRDSLVSTLRSIAIMIIPGSVGIAILAWPIVAIIFQTGRYDAMAVGWTANTLAYQAIGLIFIATSRIITQCLYALKDYKSPTYAALISMITNIILSVLLMKPLGTAGIALANSIASLIGLAFLVMTINKKIDDISWKLVIGGWGAAGVASTAMGALAYVGSRYFGLKVFHDLVTTSVRLFPLVGACVFVYIVLLFLLRVPEVRKIKHVLLHKLTT
jgi:putative peptidoglycan lipid II flippase